MIHSSLAHSVTNGIIEKAEFSCYDSEMALRTALVPIFLLFFAFLSSAEAEDNDAWIPKGKVRLLGVGLMPFGMPVAQAIRILGVTLIEDRLASGEPDKCYFIHPNGTSETISFMVLNAKVVRADVSSARVKTESGLGVGSLEKDILKRWPKQIRRIQQNSDSKHHFLEFIPLAKHEKDFRILFETDGKRVTKFRVGLLPGVGYSDGCS